MFQISVLPNGIRVATAKLPTKTVLTSVFTNVGSRYETPEENGLSHFLEHMAFKGTEKRDAKTLGQTVEVLGADFNAFTSQHTTAYLVTGLSIHQDVAVEVLADIMQNSTYDQDELEKEREVVLQEIHQYDDDIHSVAWYAFVEAAYPDQPLGRSILGPAENVQGFTRDMVKSYFSRHYHADEMAVIAVGDVDHYHFVELTERYFGKMQGGDANTHEPAEYKGGVKVISDPRFDQAHVHVGFGAPGENDPGYPAYLLLANLLGGGMSSPLFQEVRENRGLCYAIGAAMSGAEDHSIFVIHGNTTPEHLNELLAVSAQELKKVVDGNIDPVDFERAVNTVMFSLASRDEKAMRMIQYAARDIFRKGEIEPTEALMARYQAVCIEDVIEAAQALLKTPITVCIAGNVEDVDYAEVFKRGLV